MFGFIRKWWRRRSRMYRCDDCGKMIVRSEQRAAVRIEPIKKGVETAELTKTLDRVRELRMTPGMKRVVLICPKCDEKQKVSETELGMEKAKKIYAERG